MIEFNPDGSIKMPGRLAHLKQKEDRLMSEVNCMKVRKEIVSEKSPKSCMLHFTISEKTPDTRFVDTIYNEWARTKDTPARLLRDSNKEFRVIIGTDFKRCQDCTSLIRRYHNFIRNLIEKDGSCSYKKNMQSRFCYEDYFD